jgi:hypothetical protein
MRTMGIRPGDAVLVIEHRGAQQIVYNGLVVSLSMRIALAGALGEPAIRASFVLPVSTVSTGRVAEEIDVVHISHRDWIEGRAGLAYEELPAPTPGVCRYCRCTERRVCLLASGVGCSWIYPEKTVCSKPECEEKYVRDNLLRTAEREKASCEKGSSA